MALTDSQREQLKQIAEREGVDPQSLIEEAEAQASKSADDSTNESNEGSGVVRPLAERMLIGFLPFVTVREFRSLWLGLDERVPDDNLMTGEWSLIHGEQSGQSDPTPEGE